MPGPVRTGVTPPKADPTTVEVSRNGQTGNPAYDPTYDPNSALYIDRRGTSDTRDQVQQEAEQRVDQDIENSSWWEIWKRFTRNSDVNDQYNQEMSAQARQLAAGVDTRPPPGMQQSNYLSYDHSALKPMVTEGVDPDQVGEMGDLYLSAGNAMTKFQTDVASAINNSQADWQGQAGDQARKFMADVGNWVGTAGQSAQLAGTQTSLQAAALAEAKNSMPEEKPFDADAANRDLATTTNPLDMMRKYATYMNDYRESQAAHQEAARVVGTYDGALGSSSTMPAFAAPPTMGGGGTGDPGNPGEGDGTKKPGGNGVDVNGGTGTGTGSTGTGSGSIQPGGTNPPSGGGGSGSGSGGTGGGSGSGVGPIPRPPGGGAGTNPGGFDGGLPQGPGGGSQLPGGGGHNQGGFPGGMPPMGPGPMGPGMGGDDSARSGRGGGGSGGGGRAGFGPGGGLGGGGGGLGAAGGAGGRGVGSGVMPGAGAGALAAEHAATGGRGGAAAGRGGAGAGMGGGMGGGGRGQGGEDEEHQRPSYLVEADPDAMFGTDEMTAPPVIGG
ncbi:Endoglucanase [Alloactinosynnema sp. L-07]|uniref:hypothetical protein n=1 Tax=Alloactinosynnema sp. L-07 TaxID=1653480 RepID=UPI00065EF0DB|nr:hypothetical protein [Alloactinosynnema sp. L-07]CRK60398.1 Endoglucanase [Alloactinosynnema sp. L-07]